MKSYTKHLLISLISLFVLTSILFILKDFIRQAVINPLNYINSDLPVTEIYFTTIFMLLVVIVVFVSYIVYLLLTYNTRFNLEIWKATESLTLSKEQFKRLYESAPMPYVMLDKNAEVHDPNKAALRFFGVIPEEIEGKNFFSYLSGGDKEQAEKFFQYYKSRLAINREEVEMITKSGDTRWVQLSVFGITNPSNLSSVGLAMIFDITEQKLMDKAKTEFVSLASHQLKSPLATTKWLTEMLISEDFGGLSAKQQEYVEKLYTANEDMVDLVDMLLNVSKIEMGSLSLDIKRINVEELVESVLKELAFFINKKNIRIDKRYNNSLQNIKSDPKLLRIVIQNLISNAIKYTPEGGTVTIAFEESSNKKQIIISDTGLGITKKQQGRIFSKLFRADNVRGLNDSQGTGLGLYLVKSIVNSMGGNIDFVSEENKGSTFTVTL